MKRTIAVLAMLAAMLPLVFPASLAAQETAPAEGAEAPVATDSAAAASAPKDKPCQPGIGCVTNLPLPRFVSLKGSEGNARRGPGLTHRIDWVFTRSGMPLRITAEFENWRRVEDAEGAGGWVHYSLLSGARTALVTLDMAEFRDAPSKDATVVAQAETGVIGRILACQQDWCRIALDGQRGWVAKSAIWGVNADEVFD
jgi:SH3-like domain-containing protein